ncbi:uncharacterized protein LOC105008820 isoform X2 [Esox lucius]|uniref:uncharacterized protein LOC105008820 isoform X2 n=1 Tax=Esox lucius TaxID=8010 RepID=UPI0009733005|nr:uncharacterized protein LOC105008820 isoform X2 [Esox lucius]
MDPHITTCTALSGIALSRRRFSMNRLSGAALSRRHHSMNRLSGAAMSFWAVCMVLSESQSYAKALNTCFKCLEEDLFCQKMNRIFNKENDETLWEESGAKQGLPKCPRTPPPMTGQCVPCLEDLQVLIVCSNVSAEIELDLEASDGKSLSYTAATCPTLETVGGSLSQSASHSGHLEPNLLMILMAGWIVILWESCAIPHGHTLAPQTQHPLPYLENRQLYRFKEDMGSWPTPPEYQARKTCCCPCPKSNWLCCISRRYLTIPAATLPPLPPLGCPCPSGHPA